MSAAKRSKPKPDDRTLVARIVSAPRVQRASVADDRLKDLATSAGKVSAMLAIPEPPLRALLCAVADHSPYLWSLARAAPQRLSNLLASVPETRFDACLDQMRRGCEAAADDEAILRALRLGKQEGHLLIAL